MSLTRFARLSLKMMFIQKKNRLFNIIKNNKIIIFSVLKFTYLFIPGIYKLTIITYEIVILKFLYPKWSTV